MNATVSSASHGVYGTLNYLGDMRETPRFHVHERRYDNLNLCERFVMIADGRAEPIRLEEHGFCLVQHRTAADLTRRRDVLRVYRREMSDLIRELTGATHAIAAPLPVIRADERCPIRSRSAVHRPIRFVHSDYTDGAARHSIDGWLKEEDSPPECDGRRWAIYHAWRILSRPPHDTPLALCDARTTATYDMVKAETILDFPGSRRDRTETLLFRYSDRHRWFYFPDMTQDEVLVFRQFDSDERALGHVPHTAFREPSCRADAPGRISIELRVVAIF